VATKKNSSKKRKLARLFRGNPQKTNGPTRKEQFIEIAETGMLETKKASGAKKNGPRTQASRVVKNFPWRGSPPIQRRQSSTKQLKKKGPEHQETQKNGDDKTSLGFGKITRKEGGKTARQRRRREFNKQSS